MNIPDGALDHLRSLIEMPELTGTRYVLRGAVARGGMGSVYLVEDQELNRQVALKVLTLPDESGRLIARMLQEARVLAQLEHPSIVPIHDVGRLADGRIFYTMKLVQGTTLTEYLSHNRPLPDRLRLMQQVCQAIAFAHSRGIIHRDIKPDNIMVGSFGEVLVMDWGVARQGPPPTEQPAQTVTLESADTNTAVETIDQPTANGALIGTLPYMSPEQAGGQIDAVNSLSDVYMLGATLYYVLVGRPPHSGRSARDIQENILRSDPPSPREIDSSIPRPLAAVCQKAMARDRNARYQRAEELSDELRRILDGLPVAAYPENLFEKMARWVTKNQFVVLVILAYVVLRVITFFLLKP